MPSGALTLLEQAKLMPDNFATGVISTYATAYQPMTVLPLQQAVGGRWGWNVEDKLPYTTGGARNFDADFSATKSAISPFSENIRIYGGRVQVDRMLQKIDPNGVARERDRQIAAYARLLTKDIFEGSSGTYLRGIQDWLNNETLFASQTVNVGDASNCSALLTDHMDKLLNKIALVPGSTFIYTRQNVAMRISKLARGTTISGDVNYQSRFTPDQFGYFTAQYNGVPVIALVDGKGTDVLGTEGDECATVYAVTFGTEMFTGFQVSAPEVIELGDSTSDNFFDYEHGIGTAPQAVRCIARLRYVSDSM